MLAELRKPANIATAVRFFSIPVLWVLAFLDHQIIGNSDYEFNNTKENTLLEIRRDEYL